MASGNVKCAIHGEHGNTSQGKCWYCVQVGLTAVPLRVKVPIKGFENQRDTRALEKLVGKTRTIG